MARVLIAEKIAEAGLEDLRSAGHEVVETYGLTAEELPGALAGCQGLVIRSATQVTAEVLAQAADLKVVGRAGVGLDNVDVAAATERGVLVANAPDANVVSAAEHTLALLLAVARNVPQAHTQLTAGAWERAVWSGVELSEKTLGIVGFGRIGRLVAERARAFGMRIIAHDPHIPADAGEEIGVALVTLDSLVAESDFITLHVAKTPETMNLVDAALLAKARPNLRIVNVSRGGIINEADLAAAVQSGQIAGAALDVFAEEPTTESPLFGLPGVVVTPHLGASTREAQDRAGTTIADQVRLALAGETVPFAVNADDITPA